MGHAKSIDKSNPNTSDPKITDTVCGYSGKIIMVYWVSVSIRRFSYHSFTAMLVPEPSGLNVFQYLVQQF